MEKKTCRMSLQKIKNQIGILQKKNWGIKSGCRKEEQRN